MTETKRSALYSADKIRSAFSHFMKGKVAASIGGFLFQVFVAREMSQSSYAVYAVAFGLINVVGMLSSLGLKHTVQRYVSEFRVQNEDGIVPLTLSLIVLRVLLAIFFCVLLVAIASPFANFFGLGHAVAELESWIPVLGVIVVFNFLSVVMDTFVLQRLSKWVYIFLISIRLSGLFLMSYSGIEIDIYNLAYLELLAFGSSVAMYSIMLGFYLSGFKCDFRAVGWDAYLPRMSRFSFYNYLREIVYLFSGQASNRLVVAKFLPIQSIAAYGFAAQIMEALQRYLPAQLLRNMFTPMLMAYYAEERSTSKLNSMSFVIFKTNLFLLSPLLIFFYFFGADAMQMLSDGKYPESGWMALMLVGMLIVNGHTQVLQLLANATEKNSVLFSASIVNALFIGPSIYAAYKFGVAGLLITRLSGLIVSDIYLAFRLIGSGVNYSFDIQGSFRIACVVFATAIVTYFFAPLASNAMTIIALGMAICCIFVTIAFFVKPFSQEERDGINKLLGRRLFVW